MKPTLPLLFLALAGCGTAPQGTAAPGAPIAPSITKAELAAHVKFLSSDLLEGRGVGTRGDQLAREYLATELQSYGLQPGAADGSWVQPVPILGITTTVDRTLTATGKGGTATFAAPDDFTAVAGVPRPASRGRTPSSCSSATASTRPNSSGTTSATST